MCCCFVLLQQQATLLSVQYDVIYCANLQHAMGAVGCGTSGCVIICSCATAMDSGVFGSLPLLHVHAKPRESAVPAKNCLEMWPFSVSYMVALVTGVSSSSAE
jgi:hypothetical protein